MLVEAIIYEDTKDTFILGEPSKTKNGKSWPFGPTRGGVLMNPNFLSNFSKTKFALELSKNVMKHIHKWGSNAVSIHEVVGAPIPCPKLFHQKIGLFSSC